MPTNISDKASHHASAVSRLMRVRVHFSLPPPLTSELCARRGELPPPPPIGGWGPKCWKATGAKSPLSSLGIPPETSSPFPGIVKWGWRPIRVGGISSEMPYFPEYLVPVRISMFYLSSLKTREFLLLLLGNMLHAYVLMSSFIVTPTNINFTQRNSYQITW